MPHVYVIEGVIARRAWKQILVIEDQRVTIYDLDSVPFGWRPRSVTTQGEADWPGMTAGAIVAWKRQQELLGREATTDEIAFVRSRRRDGGRVHPDV